VTALAETISSVLQDIGFDGVDLDWEGPQYDAACAAKILKSLRTIWPTGIITTAVGPAYGDDQVAQARDLGDAADVIDGLMIMSYIPPDQTWTWWVVPTPVTPLHGAPSPWEDAQPYSIDRDLAVWTSGGIPASKVVMGVGGFGTVWADTNNDGVAPVTPYSNYDDLATDPSCTQQYVCDNGAAGEVAPLGCTDNSVTQLWVDRAVSQSNGKLTLKTDAVGGVTYWAAPAQNDLAQVPNPCGSGSVDVGSIYYESPASMKLKLSYIESKGMLGMEFWTLSQMINADGEYPNFAAIHSSSDGTK